MLPKNLYGVVKNNSSYLIRCELKRVSVDLGGKAVVICDVAASPADQARGLQVRASLVPGDGMLFPFSPARAATFHMGSVSYPIDIVFVGADNRVAKIIHDAQPGAATRWGFATCSAVVELPGGFAQRVGLGLGALVLWPSRVAAPGGAEPYDLLRGLTEDPVKTNPSKLDTHDDRGLPDEVHPDAMDDAAPHWVQQTGYDQINPAYREHEGPGVRAAASVGLDDLVTDAVVALVGSFTGPWKHSERGVEIAVLTPNTVTKALRGVETPRAALEWLTTPTGMKILGDGLILAGLADTAETVYGNLILRRGVTEI